METRSQTTWLPLLLEVALLLLSLATAANSLYVRNEVAQTRVEIIERIQGATKDLVQRRELDQIERRISKLEDRQETR